MPDENAQIEWSFAKNLGFRFACCFFGLYFFPFPLDLIPGTGSWWGWWHGGWKAIVIWTGAHVLRLPQPIVYGRAGSGDTTHDYVFVLVLAVVSMAATLIWSVVDRKCEDTRLGGWLRVFLRYQLAVILLDYGFNKVFPLQFPRPGNLLLTQPLDHMTPMMLAWTFMGYSVPYTIFAGALECLGGLLLLFRRTATLGALVAVAVLTNVVMMNLCYDIPVKLHSSLYLVMALAILAPELKRVAAFFIFHRPVEPEDVRPPQWTGWKRKAYWVAKVMLIGWIVGSNAYDNWRSWREYRYYAAATPGAVEGFFEIERMVKDGVEIPRLYTDGQGWRWVSISGSYLRIVTMDGTRFPSRPFNLDEVSHAMAFNGGTGTLNYIWADPQHLELKGTLDGSAIELWLEKRERADTKLMGRGFHWINEHPYTQ